jgi:hypothetical protein
MAIYADVLFLTSDYQKIVHAVNIYNVVSLFRMLRMLYLLGELKQF